MSNFEIKTLKTLKKTLKTLHTYNVSNTIQNLTKQSAVYGVRHIF